MKPLFEWYLCLTRHPHIFKRLLVRCRGSVSSRYRKQLGPKLVQPCLSIIRDLTYSSVARALLWQLRGNESEVGWWSFLSNLQAYKSLWPWERREEREESACWSCQWARIAFPQETPWNAQSDLNNVLWVQCCSWGSTRKSWEDFKPFSSFFSSHSDVARTLC